MSKKNQKNSNQPELAETTSIVKPIIQIEGEKHFLQELHEGPEDEIPELTSVGMVALGKGNRWVSFVMKSKGTKVLSIEVAEPDQRAIAEESSKINFVNHFMNEGL